MTKTSTQYQGILRPPGLRKGLAGLLMASFFMAVSSGAHADAFGSGGGGLNNALLTRLSALEKELKTLKEREPGSPQAAVPGNPGPAPLSVKPKLTLPAPPGLDELPSGGTDERERLLVEKELTHEVLGSVNDKFLVRDGDRELLLTTKELRAFEKEKRRGVVRKLKVEAVAQNVKVDFPQLQVMGESAPEHQAVMPPPMATPAKQMPGKTQPPASVNK